MSKTSSSKFSNLDSIPGEIEAAKKKIMIIKEFDEEAEQKIFNLN